MKYLPIVVALLIVVISNWCSYFIGSKDGYKMGFIKGYTTGQLWVLQNNPNAGYTFSDSPVTRLDNVYTQCVVVPGTKDEFDCEPIK